jgi:hypothetical protein
MPVTRHARELDGAASLNISRVGMQMFIHWVSFTAWRLEALGHLISSSKVWEIRRVVHEQGLREVVEKGVWTDGDGDINVWAGFGSLAICLLAIVTRVGRETYTWENLVSSADIVDVGFGLRFLEVLTRVNEVKVDT